MVWFFYKFIINFTLRSFYSKSLSIIFTYFPIFFLKRRRLSTIWFNRTTSFVTLDKETSRNLYLPYVIVVKSFQIHTETVFCRSPILVKYQGIWDNWRIIMITILTLRFRCVDEKETTSPKRQVFQRLI